MNYGKILSNVKEGNKLTISFEKQKVIIEVVKADIINFFVPFWNEQHYSKAIEGNKSIPTDFTVTENEGTITLETAVLKVVIGDGFVTSIYDKLGNLLLTDYTGSRKQKESISQEAIALLESEGHDVSKYSDRTFQVETIKKMDEKDVFFGMGDKSGFLNKRGFEYEDWNSDIPQAHNEDYHALYKSIPFYLCKKENGCYGMFFDNTFRSYFNFGKEDPSYFFYEAEDGNLDYYFIGGEKLTDIVTNYTYLTGTTPRPALWTLGYHQCRWGYECAEDIREVAKQYRKLRIPCESVQYDIDYMDAFRVFTWNEKAYGTPGALFKELGAEGFKPVVIIDPGTKMEPGYFMYEEGVANNYFATDKDGNLYVNEVWPGDANYPDFGRQEVRDWWGSHIKFLTDLGITSIWNDMNEPASFRGELPLDVVFHEEDRVATHAEMHNVYGHFMSKATYEGVKKLTGKRPLVITRACYAGTQKYSAVWTGDNQSLWHHLQMLVPQLCNLGISGFSLCGTDIGGFGADCNPELLTRWIQAATFSPFFRNHSAKGTRRQEPWQFGEQVTDIYRKYVNLRYQFLPYIYDLMAQGEQNGLPVMRPLVLHYENDPETYNLNSEFLVGEQMLVAPVLEQGVSRRMIYLPEGVWYDYWTGERMEGKQYFIRETPIDVCPIYIKEGAMIPMYPVMQYVGEKPYDTLKLLTTPGEASGTHYQDNGMDYAYRNGEYNAYRFVKDADNKLSVEMLHEGYTTYKDIQLVLVGQN